MCGAAAMTPVRKRSWRMPVAVTSVVVTFLAACVRLLPLTAAASSTRSVAVLLFENKGPAEQAYFADDIVDALRDKLARLETSP